MASIDAGFATLDPGHLGDLSQSSGVGSPCTSHPSGHSASGSWEDGWLRHSAAKRNSDFRNFSRESLKGFILCRLFLT